MSLRLFYCVITKFIKRKGDVLCTFSSLFNKNSQTLFNSIFATSTNRCWIEKDISKRADKFIPLLKKHNSYKNLIRVVYIIPLGTQTCIQI